MHLNLADLQKLEKSLEMALSSSQIHTVFMSQKVTINPAAETNLHIFSSSVQCFENKQLYFANKLQDAMKVKYVSSTNTFYSSLGLEESIKKFICNVSADVSDVLQLNCIRLLV